MIERYRSLEEAKSWTDYRYLNNLMDFSCFQMFRRIYIEDFELFYAQVDYFNSLYPNNQLPFVNRIYLYKIK